MVEVIENFLTDEESHTITLIDVTKFGRKVWEKKSSGNVKVVRSNIKPFVPDLVSKHNLPYSCAVELLKYSTLSMSDPHLDVKGSHYDSSSQHRIVEWSRTGIVILNNDFEGGELYFPELKLSFGKEMKNALITFPAGEHKIYTHGVKQVISGVRYSLVFRYEKE